VFNPFRTSVIALKSLSDGLINKAMSFAYNDILKVLHLLFRLVSISISYAFAMSLCRGSPCLTPLQ
jgi:hypothetical protein